MVEIRITLAHHIVFKLGVSIILTAVRYLFILLIVNMASVSPLGPQHLTPSTRAHVRVVTFRRRTISTDFTKREKGVVKKKNNYFLFRWKIWHVNFRGLISWVKRTGEKTPGTKRAKTKKKKKGKKRVFNRTHLNWDSLFRVEDNQEKVVA